MDKSSSEQFNLGLGSITSFKSPTGPADEVKVKNWLEGADRKQCHYMANYLLKRAGGGPVHQYLENGTAKLYAELVQWLLLGTGWRFQDVLIMENAVIRRHGAMFFARGLDAWGQRQGRICRNKVVGAQNNAVCLDSKTKKQLRKLASEQGVSDEEFLASMIAGMVTRRGGQPPI